MQTGINIGRKPKLQERLTERTNKEFSGDFLEEVTFKQRFKVEKDQPHGEQSRLVTELVCFVVKSEKFGILEMLIESQWGCRMVSKLVSFCEHEGLELWQTNHIRVKGRVGR